MVMDSLLESASTYAEVLRNCSSVKVAEWKQEDLERAVNWAEYFKRVRVTRHDVMTIVASSHVTYT